MRLGIGFGAERLGLAVLRWPRGSATLLFLLLIAIGVSLPHLKFDDDIHRVFLSDSPLSKAQRRLDSEHSIATSTVLARIASKTPFSSSEMAILQGIASRLQRVEGVREVLSPFLLRMPPDLEAPAGQVVLGEYIGEDYGARIDAFRSLNSGLSPLINRKRTALLMSINLRLGKTTLAQVLPLLEAEVRDALPEQLSLGLTGEEAISVEIVSGLKDDLISLNLWGALLVVLAVLALLRDLKMVVLAVVPAMCGAVSLLALSVWLSYPITVLSNVIPILLLVLGVSNGIHLAGHLKNSQANPADTLRQIGPACALTALTTAAAFASIMATGNAQLFEFAVLGALGTLLAFALTIAIFALLAIAIRPSDRPIPSFASRMARTIAAVGVRFPKAILFLSPVVLVAATFGYFQTKARFPVYQNLPDSSTTNATNDAIAEDFGGVFQMVVEVDNDWNQLTTLTKALQGVAGKEAVRSQVNLARWLGRAAEAPSAEVLSRFPVSLTDQLRTGTGGYRIFVATPEPMRSEASLRNFDSLYNTARAGGAAQILGLPTVMRQEAVTLISQLSRGLVIAALGATLLVALAFRSIFFFPILLVPNILPLMVTGASLHFWTDGTLTPTAVLALTIAFGIAVDDTVHFVGRYTHARNSNMTPKAATQFAIRSAGEVMVLSTLLLSIGLSVTLASVFFPIRLFGGMMITTLWAALAFDLLLLPALFHRQSKQGDVR